MTLWYVASYHVCLYGCQSLSLLLTGEVKPRQELPDVKPPTPEVANQGHQLDFTKKPQIRGDVLAKVMNL